MSGSQPSWIEQHCAHLIQIERETIAKLGEEMAGFFVNTANDCMAVSAAVIEAYPGEQSCNLIPLTLVGLFKETYWFHSFFVSGNYPLLLSRLRFVWESMFRAYFAVDYSIGPCRNLDRPGSTPDDKVAWLDIHEKKLNWDTCIEPVLTTIFPLAAREEEVRNHYKVLFKELHRYAHPSAYLLGRMTDDSALLVKDGFDESWARQTVEAAAKVFDLIFMAVFAHHPNAYERVELTGKYPILELVGQEGKAGP